MSVAATLPDQERTGARAKLRTIRMSAFKARAVLKLISGKSYEEAVEVLTFCDRVAADEILKCLRSAAANAEHNESLEAEELFVSQCFANEGPTLKRWRPRARGRATRINKRTCHITIVLSRYTAEELLALSERTSSRSAAAAADRRRRVAASQAPADADQAGQATETEVAELTDSTDSAMAETDELAAAEAAVADEEAAVEETAAEAAAPAEAEPNVADEETEPPAAAESPASDSNEESRPN